MLVSRRGFFSGLVALVTAPAIVRVENIMHVVPSEIILPEPLVIATQRVIPVEYAVEFTPRNNLLSINEITREAIQLFKNSNACIQALDREYLQEFSSSGAKIGTQLRVKLPYSWREAVIADRPARSQISFAEWTRKFAA